MNYGSKRGIYALRSGIYLIFEIHYNNFILLTS
jgi:hypothetical protein